MLVTPKYFITKSAPALALQEITTLLHAVGNAIGNVTLKSVVVALTEYVPHCTVGKFLNIERNQHPRYNTSNIIYYSVLWRSMFEKGSLGVKFLNIIWLYTVEVQNCI